MADFEAMEEILTTRNKERHTQAIEDLHEFREAKTGLTPLLLASCNTHNSDLVVLLYQHGVKLDQLGMHRETCLHLAARQAREDVLTKLLQMLNETPDLKKQLIDKRDDEGSTPLMCACFAGDIPCMRLLREHGAFLDQRNYRGQTPLMKAVCFRNQRVLDWLLTAQVDTLLRDKEDRQAVDYARERGLTGMMEKISGKTITDEFDMWIDEKAEITGAGSHLLENSRTSSSAHSANANAISSVAASSMALQNSVHQEEYQQSFEHKFQASGTSAVSSAMVDMDYTYTPVVDETDPYQIYTQEQIDEKWQEFTDYDNDCQYWYNQLTSESVYERPWALGGPMEYMDVNVADAKVAIFKGMLSTSASKVKVSEGTVVPANEENDNEKNYEKKVKAIPAELRKAAIQKVGKKEWKKMSFKERYNTLGLDNE